MLRSNSLVEIARKFESQFEECLFREKCLINGTLHFLNCLLTKCPLEEFVADDDDEPSPLLKCLFGNGPDYLNKRSLFFTYGIRRGDIELTDLGPML